MGMSGDRSSRQFALVAETRRQWSKAEKRSIVAESSGTCANISAVARRHGLKPSLLFRWRKMYGVNAAPLSPASPMFVPVALLPPSLPVPAPSSIEILLTGGCTIRVTTDVDVDALARIVAALEARR